MRRIKFGGTQLYALVHASHVSSGYLKHVLNRVSRKLLMIDRHWSELIRRPKSLLGISRGPRLVSYRARYRDFFLEEVQATDLEDPLLAAY